MKSEVGASEQILPPKPPSVEQEQHSQLQLAENADSDSDTASTATNDSKEKDDEGEEEEFLNEQDTSEGPEILNLPPISIVDSGVTDADDIQFFHIEEEQIQYRMYAVANIPKSIALLNADFE